MDRETRAIRNRMILLAAAAAVLFCLSAGKTVHAAEKGIPEVSVLPGSGAIEAEPDGTVGVTMECASGYEIRYTLDGSLPDTESAVCTGMLRLTGRETPESLASQENTENMPGGETIGSDESLPRGTVVRAAAFSPDGTSGPVTTRTYFIGTNIASYYGVPVISIVTDPDDLTGYEEGIFVRGAVYDEWVRRAPDAEEIAETKPWEADGNCFRRGRAWERAVSMTFFDGAGRLAWQENCGIRVRGHFSRSFGQKSLGVYFRNDYGKRALDYALIPGNTSMTGETVTFYRRFQLRNGGNTAEYLKFKDLALQSLAAGRAIDIQTGCPAVVFINGTYWGVYCLQERYSPSWYAAHRGVSEDNVIFVNEGEVDGAKPGDEALYEELMSYAEKDLSDPDVYREFCGIVDVRSMIDFYAVEIYIGNAFYNTTENEACWRVREPDGTAYGDGKWRWSLFDTEYSSALYGKKKTAADWDSDRDVERMRPLFRSAMKNRSFREAFLAALKEIGSTYYDPDRVRYVLDQYAKEWEPLMQDYYKRFGGEPEMLRLYMDKVKLFFYARYPVIVRYAERRVGMLNLRETVEKDSIRTVGILLAAVCVLLIVRSRIREAGRGRKRALKRKRGLLPAQPEKTGTEGKGK